MVVASDLFPFYRKILPNYSYFNLRLREGGDGYDWSQIGERLDFNPRLRKGGDASVILCNDAVLHFNPYLREGGDRAARLFS